MVVSVDDLYAQALEHYAAGRLDEAQRCCEAVVAQDPMVGVAWERLGRIAERKGDLALAVALLERAIPLLAAPAECHHALGLVLHRLGQGEAALAHYRRAEALGLVHPAVHTNAGLVLRELGRLKEAVAEQLKARALAPEAPAVLINLGSTLGLEGRVDEGLVYLRQAVRLDPSNPTAHSNLLLFLLYSDSVSPAEHFERSRAFGALWPAPEEPAGRAGLGAAADAGVDTAGDAGVDTAGDAGVDTAGDAGADTAGDAGADTAGDAGADTAGDAGAVPILGPRRRGAGRLRVGLLSPDLRHHAVASFLRPLVEHRDRRRVEVFAYADLPEPDGVTRFFRQTCDGFRDVFGLPDEVLLHRIREDDLDVLLDLAGHTARNRLAVFARRAAPLQVTYLGYPATTGLAAMDVRLTDVWADPPPAAAGRHTEALVYLPRGFLVYAPPAPAPPVRELSQDRDRSGRVTFGCFNNLAKLSTTLYRHWAELLARLPHARLLLKNKSFADPATRQRVTEIMAGLGVDPARVALRLPLASEKEHLAAYEEVDIALDSFPYGGTTTTCEALWMGVPVVTWVGESHHSRVGRSILEQVGLPELCAHSGQAYLATAAQLARDGVGLRTLRAGLRQRMAASPLLDGPGQARDFYQALWDAFARGRPA